MRGTRRCRHTSLDAGLSRQGGLSDGTSVGAVACRHFTFGCTMWADRSVPTTERRADPLRYQSDTAATGEPPLRSVTPLATTRLGGSRAVAIIGQRPG